MQLLLCIVQRTVIVCNTADEMHQARDDDDDDDDDNDDAIVLLMLLKCFMLAD